ncbi:class I SAM-dependent methyltransferase [Halobacteriovorax sp. RT-1-4]|uniref:class I SAM-dependent methyltransferase n=1 Tax=unclassified Halobacteriovorax TaxID=2639665 RepID=UPI003999EA53
MKLEEELKQNNQIYKDLVETGVFDESSEFQLYSDSVRDAKINVFKERKTGVIFLENIDQGSIEKYNERKGVDYWSSESREDALLKTRQDDLRRFEMIVKKENPEKWLDIGTGLGGVLELAKNLDINTFGVEPQNEIRQLLNELNMNIYDSLDNFDKKVDLITLFHVLEHIPAQIDFLKLAKSKMTIDGVIYIEVPHAKDALLEVYNNEAFKKFTLWSEHLILHTKESLKSIVEYAGFRVEEEIYFQRYSLANHLNWLNNSLPNGQNVYTQIEEDRELVQAYNNNLIHNKCTDTLIFKCVIND